MGTEAVHPRSRGEYGQRSRADLIHVGSSPLTRGIRSISTPLHPHRRFIPAHAGNTGTSGFNSLLQTVHPRSRGEYGTVLLQRWSTHGSSPLTRGILLLSSGIVFCLRFIPAHAGNTPYELAIGYGPSVHPRSRGEYARVAETVGTTAGSSPLTRGIHFLLSLC